MNNIPAKLRKEMANDPEMQLCMRKELLNDHVCGSDPLTGKHIEWDHCIIYAGRQLQEAWAIVPTCWQAHRGGDLDREKQTWIALNRATDEQLKSISKAIDYIRERDRLNSIYC